MHRRTYVGNPKDLYSVDEMKDFYVYNKTQGFPYIQPDGGSWVQRISMHRRTYAGNPNDLYSVDEMSVEHVRERWAIYRQRQAWSNGWQAWSNDSQSAWNKHAIRVLLPDWSRWAERNKALSSTGLWLKPVLKTFLTSFAIFWTRKRLKLGMVSSFDPHNMCAKVERVTTKTGCTSCTNWTISFEVWGF